MINFYCVWPTRDYERSERIKSDRISLNQPWHTPYSWNIMCHKSEGNCGLWVQFKKICWKFEKKIGEPFGSCLLNSTANPAKLGWKWAGLAVLFSRYLPNGSHDFFQTFSTDFYYYFIKNPQTTIALGF